MKSRWTIALTVALYGVAAAAPQLAVAGADHPDCDGEMPSAATAPMHVRILRTPGDTVREQRWAFLISALDHTVTRYGPYLLDAYTSPMSTQREISETLSGKLINVIASDIGHPDLNAGAIPIPIPIDKGLLGYRVALIRRDRQAALANVHDIASLRQFSVGQAADWGDVAIYKFNGIPIVAADHYRFLFPMLEHGRFDMFPRGVTEITEEMATFHEQFPDMAIESHILIRYPYAEFFYVSKSCPRLARRIEDGLEAMREDGSFDRLFDASFSQAITALKLGQRVIIDLKNPFVPDWLPVDHKALWLDPLATYQ
jgi:hypothetical protein